jgi:hydrogenase maturation protein HypF
MILFHLVHPGSADSIAPLSPSDRAIAQSIRIRGTVQGVGFRPTVYRLAVECGLRGEVCNDGEGVLIRAAGSAHALATFVHRLQQECPPLARIESIHCQPLSPDAIQVPTFTISASLGSPVHTTLPPDAATCPQCRAEILDPRSRWFGYPFTNCTHCGPRLSIVRAIPYDRRHTSMAAFPLCPDCQRDYAEVSNRRFHAQPIACPVCGPQVWLEDGGGDRLPLESLDQVRDLLVQGAIVAIKGIGGIHLACDATHDWAVQSLRQRKHRYHKPFALMARDLAVIERYCAVGDRERALLASPAAPIVLLDQLPFAVTPALSPAIAPGLRSLGFMLPYSPLHHLILKHLEHPIVLTSGNRADEPQCIGNQEARQQLSALADYWLLHDREIVNRVDDSVVRVSGDRVQILRRARGYAPAPLRLPPGFEQTPAILGLGGELKNTICLLRQGEAILSQHLGDLENAAAFAAYQQTLDLYLRLLEHQPQVLAVDQHPEYLSTKFGRQWAESARETVSLQSVQHHHAHVAACLIDNGVPLETEAILGIALDGLGYGLDGSLWGGEFLLADYRQFTRLAHFKPIALLGGAQAIYQPWRNTYAHLQAAFGSGEAAWQALHHQYGELELLTFLDRQPRSLLEQLSARGINATPASSAGRLFDAVAAALGICREQASYEGQGAVELEALTDADSLHQSMTSAYPFAIDRLPSGVLMLEPRPLWQALLADLQQGVPRSWMAARFHLGLAAAIASLVQTLQDQHGFEQVALTGGVFQNQILQEQVRQHLTQRGLTVLLHQQVPANDGGLALGQAAIAAAQATLKRPLS